jgi:hypothetical protein
LTIATEMLSPRPFARTRAALISISAALRGASVDSAVPISASLK